MTKMYVLVTTRLIVFVVIPAGRIILQQFTFNQAVIESPYLRLCLTLAHNPRCRSYTLILLGGLTKYFCALMQNVCRLNVNATCRTGSEQ